MAFGDLMIFVLLSNSVYTHTYIYIVLQITPYHTLPYHIISHHITSYHIISLNITSYHIIPCFKKRGYLMISWCYRSVLLILAMTAMPEDGLTGSAWGDWANYTASPLRAFENELGVQAPVGFWDPAGFTADGSVEDFKRRRATEIKHGRISMLATMGYITPVTWICWSCV